MAVDMATIESSPAADNDDDEDIACTTRTLLQALRTVATTRHTATAHNGKAVLQAQLDAIELPSTPRPHATSPMRPSTSPSTALLVVDSPNSHFVPITQPAQTPYLRERKASLCHIQLRQLGSPSKPFRPDKLLTTGEPRLPSSRVLLSRELTSVHKQRQLHELQEKSSQHDMTQEVVHESLHHLSSRTNDQDMSLHMRGRRQSVHRLRFSVAKVEELQLASRTSPPRPPSSTSDVDSADEDILGASLYSTVRVAQQARQLHKLSIAVKRRTVSATAERELDSQKAPADVVPKSIVQTYAQVAASLHPGAPPTALKKISGQAVLSKDEFIKMLCLTLGFDSQEWAAKCYPAACQHHGKSQERSVTLSDFAQLCHMLVHGTDLEKMKWVFSIYDRDGGGSIEVEEVFQTLQSDKEDLWDQILFSQQLLGVVDRNHDGHMEFQEFCSACSRIPMFFHCFAGALPLRLAVHPKNVKLKLGLRTLRKLWSSGLQASAPRSDAKAPSAIDVYGFTAIISYFFRLARSHPVDHALAMRLFLAFDANNDQFVDFDEFIQGLSTLMQGAPDARARMVHWVLDLDGGGTVTKQEVHKTLVSRKRGLQLHEVKGLELENHVNEIMRTLDENGDGDITVEEFQRAVRKSPRMLEALQDILFSGCRLDAEFQAAEWKAHCEASLIPPLVAAHPARGLRKFRKVLQKAVRTVASVNAVRGFSTTICTKNANNV
ncbi:hypothetical protein SPRG_11576 [Saprolegnia parasitica CBS 223.65]|uniref:EF-hand domain-containing protein n=1 Tax=Saprolegnia parasitica (strain CBS 223.65) TaxID=695850 RepID=A0A067C7N7_SAPPC|nr:hypothetical protein SPRG_11576 [Saprolegnia parasitica CBS 223.65]KDO22817.1 hypothetical protein SPRG_11576 [Saprolegnia parasitica CBS 223.65]|eukprot:XP_012206488.1 hypothetical protein SPRG_11576 [Saprolegnia parasitica CBS 223.65]